MNKHIVVGDIKVEPGTKSCGFLDVAETATRMIRIPIVIINGLKPGSTLGLLGGVHGLEYPSMESVIRLTKKVNPKNLRGAIIAATCVSEPAFEASGNQLECTSFISKVDSQNQNRVFVSRREWVEQRREDYTMSYRIADKLIDEVFPKLDYLLDFHGGDLPEDIADFVLVSFSGDKRIDDAQRSMTECFNSEIIVVTKETTPPRSTTSFCRQELNVPSLILEGGQGYNMNMDRTVFQYSGTVNLMKRLKMIPGDPKITPLPRKEEDFASITIRKYAGRGGLLYHKTGLGMPIIEGEVIAKIENLFGEVVETITSGPLAKDRVYKVRWKRVPFPVNAGDKLVQIAGIPKKYSKLFSRRVYKYCCTNCTGGY